MKDLEPDTFEETTIELVPQEVVDILFECDEKFTKYLMSKNYRWINPAKRDSWK